MIKNSSNKILILGSKGQIGRHLSGFLKHRNFEVVEIDLIINKKHDLRIHQNSFILKSIKESDFVFFLAFDVGGSPYLEKNQDKYQFIHNNTQIIANTFSMLKYTKTPFLFASSQMSNMTHSSYGILKKVGELYTHALGGIVAKFWNVYGMEEDRKKSHVITDFIYKSIRTEKIFMKTDGMEERQFLYVDDCCDALLCILNNYEQIKKKREVHVTSFESTKILKLAKIIEQISPKKIEFIPSCTKDIIQNNLKNEADDYLLKFWKPKTSLKKGIKIIWDEMMIEYKKEKIV